MTVHLVYPYGATISCPDAIGRNVGLRLRQWGHRVIHYNWDDVRRIRPAGDDDALVGHPHYNPFTVYRRSVRMKGWRRRIAMFPFAHGLLGYAAFADAAVRRSDLALGICARYWGQTAPQSAYAHWTPKLIQTDLAIDRNDFPVVKRQFNPPGRRRVLYIGHTAKYKNPAFLGQIAQAMPDVEFSWAGGSYNKVNIPGFKLLGNLDFGSAKALEIVAAHDFLLTVGISDPNPTTILEAMAWGLIPVCTPQSGYSDYPSIPNVWPGDVAGAVAVLRGLQDAPEAQLEAMRQENWRMLDTHFTWDRFAGQVREAIESDASPAIGAEPLHLRVRLAGAALAADTSPLRMRHLSRFTYRALSGRSRSDRTVLEPIGDRHGH
jgi:glycosyltransferase involved in cell wall biosynthesis